MTPLSLREYAVRQRERYRQLTRRADKRALLDEIVAVTKLHRKAVIRLLRRAPSRPASYPRGGRPRRYGPEVGRAAAVLWEAAGHIGPHRLQPFVPELLDRLVQCGELVVPPAVDKLVRQASAATLGRLLAPRALSGRPGAWPRPGRGVGQGRSPFAPLPSGTMCNRASWRSIWSLIAAAATEGLLSVYAVRRRYRHRRNRARGRVGQAPGARGRRRSIASARSSRCPCSAWTAITARSLSTSASTRTASGHAITFTRSRAWKKNDSAHVEQKNGAIIRDLIGYDRFATKAAYAQLACRLPHRPLAHQLLPARAEARHQDARRRPRRASLWSRANPVATALCRHVSSPAQHAELETVYQRLNPLQLRRDLDRALARLWTLAVPDPRRAAELAP